MAASNGHLEVVKVLLDLGADVNQATNASLSPSPPLSLCLRARSIFLDTDCSISLDTDYTICPSHLVWAGQVKGWPR